MWVESQCTSSKKSNGLIHLGIKEYKITFWCKIIFFFKTFFGRDSFYINILHLNIIFIYTRDATGYQIVTRKRILFCKIPDRPEVHCEDVRPNFTELHDNLVGIALRNYLKILHRGLKNWSALNWKDGQTDWNLHISISQRRLDDRERSNCWKLRTQWVTKAIHCRLSMGVTGITCIVMGCQKDLVIVS